MWGDVDGAPRVSRGREVIGALFEKQHVLPSDNLVFVASIPPRVVASNVTTCAAYNRSCCYLGLLVIVVSVRKDQLAM